MLFYVILGILFFLVSLYYHNCLFFVLYLLVALYLLQFYYFVYIKIKDLISFVQAVRNKSYFKRIYGVYGYVGEYGQGKTICMVKDFLKLSKKGLFHNPDNYIFISNFGLDGTETFLTLADMICFYRQAVEEGKGLIVFWDEIQNEFPENDKNFPLEFRVLLTQNRKNYGVRLCWSTQDYTRVNKNLRLMTTKVNDMRCFFSRYQIQKVYKTKVFEDYYSTTEITKKVRKRSLSSKYWVQTDKMRNSYDSFKMLDIAKSKLGL